MGSLAAPFPTAERWNGRGFAKLPLASALSHIRSDPRAVSRDYYELEKGVIVFQDVETRPDASNGGVCGSSDREYDATKRQRHKV